MNLIIIIKSVFWFLFCFNPLSFVDLWLFWRSFQVVTLQKEIYGIATQFPLFCCVPYFTFHLFFSCRLLASNLLLLLSLIFFSNLLSLYDCFLILLFNFLSHFFWKAIGWLLSVPRASETILEVSIPYSRISMFQMLGKVQFLGFLCSRFKINAFISSHFYSPILLIVLSNTFSSNVYIVCWIKE